MGWSESWLDALFPFDPIRIAMNNMTNQTKSTVQESPKPRLSAAEAAERDLYQRLSKLHRDHLRPVGPIEQTLVETVIHNCLQIHHVQLAERDIRTFNSTSSLMNLGRLARYRAYLEHSTAKSLAQLRDVQSRRIEAKPAVMAASASAPDSVVSAVQNEPVRLPIPRPIDQPASPLDSAARPSPPTAPIQFPSPVRSAASPPQSGPDSQDH